MRMIEKTLKWFWYDGKYVFATRQQISDEVALD